MPVNTARVTGRRSLQFQSLDDILADLDSLNAGPVRSLGNWSPGQNLAHLTILMVGCLDGLEVETQFLLRTAASLLRGRVLTKPMSPGWKLPPAASVLIPPETTWTEGLHNMRSALRRMQTESHRHAHPVLGTLSVEQWTQLHCRHCELHLSFLVPEAR
jgi:hypothetical protein